MMRKSQGSASPFEGTIGFSRAVRVGPRILVSGTAPITADGHTLVAPAGAQAERCLEIIIESIEALGGTAGDVVRTRSYLICREDWDDVARAHGAVFAAVRPAATMVIVHGLLDPHWRVEIEAEAIVGARPE